MVWGLRLTGSAETIRFEDVPSPALFTTPGTKGLGSTPARTVCVPTVSPDGVLGLHPVGVSVVPKEMAPPATPTYVTVVPPPPPPLPQAEANTASTATVPSGHRQRRGRWPRPVTAAGGPG